MQCNLRDVLAQTSIEMDAGIITYIAIGISSGIEFLHNHCNFIPRDLKVPPLTSISLFFCLFFCSRPSVPPSLRPSVPPSLRPSVPPSLRPSSSARTHPLRSPSLQPHKPRRPHWHVCRAGGCGKVRGRQPLL